MDFLAPYAAGADWPYLEIGHREYGELFALLRQATVKYHDPSYYRASLNVPGVDAASHRINLTLPRL